MNTKDKLIVLLIFLITTANIFASWGLYALHASTDGHTHQATVSNGNALRIDELMKRVEALEQREAQP